jgi:hypothetical protein
MQSTTKTRKTTTTTTILKSETSWTTSTACGWDKVTSRFIYLLCFLIVMNVTLYGYSNFVIVNFYTSVMIYISLCRQHWYWNWRVTQKDRKVKFRFPHPRCQLPSRRLNRLWPWLLTPLPRTPPRSGSEGCRNICFTDPSSCDSVFCTYTGELNMVILSKWQIGSSTH